MLTHPIKTPANSNPGHDTITFSTGLDLSAAVDITLSAEIDVTGDLTIVGPGADLLTISGDDSYRISGDVPRQETKLSCSNSSTAASNVSRCKPALIPGILARTTISIKLRGAGRSKSERRYNNSPDALSSFVNRSSYAANTRWACRTYWSFEGLACVMTAGITRRIAKFPWCLFRI